MVVRVRNMFTRIRGFLYRHRRKFLITGIVVGGMMLASRYAQKKLREWQEKETREFMERTRRQHHFESTERTCNQMIMSLMHTVKESIVKILNTEELVVKLRNDPTDKVHIWEELKVLTFTRASVLVYAGAMLVVSLRIQLNLVGGYMFQDTIDEMEEGPKPPQLSSSLQESYLCLCHHFVNDGIRQLCTLVEEKVRLIVEGTSLKQRLNLQDTEQLFWAVQAAMIGDARDPVKSLGRYFFPPDRPTADNEMLQKMVLETEDLLESDEVISLTASCVSRGFSLVVDRISDYYGPAENKASLNEDAAVASTSSGYSNGVTNFVHPNTVAMPMAKLIPIVNGLIPHKNGRAGPPDSWIQHLILDEKLKLLGANVYEAFSNK